MAKLNVKNRSLFIRDNVDILDNLNSATVDLIYLDPPFNSNRTYSAPIGSKAAGSSFKDAWTLNDIDEAWAGQISEKHPALSAIISAVGMSGGKGDKAYLIFMARRLLEMRRILKDDGGIYLHCDPKMSHSLKLVMDCVFGKKNFRNEVIWHYTGGGRSHSYFSRKHDVIFSYRKKDAPVFNVDAVRMPYKKTSGFAKSGIVSAAGKHYPPHPKGTPVDDVWDIPIINPMAKERMGYPTQKPLALLERIIQASSKKGGLILDPFCGCATAMVAAEKLGRGWIGADISDTAIHLIKQRLESDKNLFEVAKKVIVRTDIPARTDNGAMMVNRREYKHVLYGLQKGECNGCKKHFPYQNFTVDHIHPQAKGGQDIESNLQLLCGFCNSIKGDREMPYLIAQLKSRGILR